MSRADFFEPYRERIDLKLSAIAAESQSEALKQDCRREFNETVPHELGKHVTLLIGKVKTEKKVHQKEFARILCVAEATLCAWKNGHISLPELVRLVHHARALGVDVPSFSEMLNDALETADMRQTMKGMETVRNLVSGTPTVPLTEHVYRSVLRAARSEEFWNARVRQEDTNRICSELFPAAGTNGRDIAWYLDAVDEWCPAFVVVVDHLITG